MFCPSYRVYSRFLANVPYVQEFENATASLFHTFTAQAVQNYRQCFAKTSVRHCAYNASLFSNSVVSVVTLLSCYKDKVSVWLARCREESSNVTVVKSNANE